MCWDRALKPVNTRVATAENGEDMAVFERTEQSTKLELYQADPLVDVKGLKRYCKILSGCSFHESQACCKSFIK